MPERSFAQKDFYRANPELWERSWKEIRNNRGERLTFSSLEQFPDTREDREEFPLPRIVDEHVKRAKYSSETYRLTMLRKEWKGEIGLVIQDFVSTDEGKRACERYAIADIHELSPKQAIQFVMHMVRRLTKYSDHEVHYTKEQILTNNFPLTRSDQQDIVTLLREGLNSYEDDAWDGNGVCRQFADYVRVVFDAIKAMQHGASLKNTHCTTESGWEYREQAPATAIRPVHVGESRYVFSDSTHAWNAFIHVSSPNEAQVIAVDVTWSTLTPNGLIHADYTQGRSEPFLHDALRVSSSDDTALLQSALRFYLARFQAHDQPWMPHMPAGDYYATRFLTAYPKGVPAERMEIPPMFRARLELMLVREMKSNTFSWQQFLEVMRKGETFGADQVRLLDCFIQNHSASDLVRFKSDHGVVAALIEAVSLHPSFAVHLEKDPELRALVRDVHPEMLRPFRPHREAADLGELRYLVSQFHILAKEVSVYVQEKYQKRSLKHLQCEDADAVFAIARRLLVQRRVDAETALFRNVNKYDLLRNFHAYWFRLDETSNHEE